MFYGSSKLPSRVENPEKSHREFPTIYHAWYSMYNIVIDRSYGALNAMLDISKRTNGQNTHAKATHISGHIAMKEQYVYTHARTCMLLC